MSISTKSGHSCLRKRYIEKDHCHGPQDITCGSHVMVYSYWLCLVVETYTVAFRVTSAVGGSVEAISTVVSWVQEGIVVPTVSDEACCLCFCLRLENHWQTKSFGTHSLEDSSLIWVGDGFCT